jgi:DNA-binding transcriptional LysR family regulator
MISVVLRDVAQHYANYCLIRIVPVELPVAMANLGIITRKTRDLSPATKGFLACLRDRAAAERPGDFEQDTAWTR